MMEISRRKSHLNAFGSILTKINCYGGAEINKISKVVEEESPVNQSAEEAKSEHAPANEPADKEVAGSSSAEVESNIVGASLVNESAEEAKSEDAPANEPPDEEMRYYPNIYHN